MDGIHDSVQARFAGDDRVVIKREPSLAFQFPASDRHTLDWAYIDGDHRYDGVRGDLEHFSRLVSRDGYLLGDDYGLDNQWWGDGVTRAVDDFVSAYDCALVVLGTQFLISL